MFKAKNNLIIFTGPSGVGKGTIVKKVFSEIHDVEFSVSCTTREKRPGEEEGRNYFYKTRAEFENLIKENKLLEYAEFVGNYYGTPRDFVDQKLKEGKDVFLEIEVQGALQVMDQFPDALSIFLVPPKFEDLEARLRKRGTENEEVLQKRLNKAREEMKYLDRFQYVVINDNVDEAASTIKSLILQARVDLDFDLSKLSQALAAFKI